MVSSASQDPIDVALVKMKSYILENYPQSRTQKLYLKFIEDFGKYRLSSTTTDGLKLVSEYYFFITRVKAFENPHEVSLRTKARPILVFKDIFLGKEPQRKYCYDRYLAIEASFIHVADLYSKWLVSVGASKGTISTRLSRLKPFFHFLCKNDCNSFTNLTNHLLLAFIQSLQDRYTAQGSANILYTLRNFFKCPTIQEDIQFDPLIFLNDIHSRKHERLPTAYTTHEVRSVMDAVNRTTKSGKTIYLMMLFACVYGLRVSDIRELKQSSIQWTQKQISLIQRKTRKHLKLPLTDEITMAILDYLKNVRPYSNDPHLFIRLRAPHVPYASSVHFASQVAVYFDKAEIDIKGRHCGLHALRHSLATELTAQNTPINEISTILGHTSLAATRDYIWSDMLNLKKAALEVPHHEIR